MQKIISIVLSFLLIAGMEAMGQDITTRLLTLTAPPPPTVKQVSTTVVGNPGNATYYYWVVAKYASGNANPSAAAIVINAPNVLSVSTYIRVNWDAVAGATGYDVLRTTTASVPNGNCNCAVVTATASTTVNDQGGALGAYTVSSQGAVSSSCNLDNLSSATPVVTCAPYGWTPGGAAGGALTGTYPNPLIANVTTPGAVAFVSATPGVLTQAATTFFWDAINDRLGIGTNSPSGTVHVVAVSNPQVRVTTGSTSAKIQVLTFSGEGLVGTETNHAFALYTNNTERARFAATTGNLLIGTTTDAGYKLQVENTGATIGSGLGVTGTNPAVVIGGNVAIYNSGSSMVFRTGTLVGTNNGTNYAAMFSNGNWTFGTSPSDGNYKLDIAASGSSGTLRVWDQALTVGTTSLVVRAGAGQSGNLTTWQNSGGSSLGYVASGGDAFFVGGLGVGQTSILYFASSSIVRAPSNGVLVLQDSAQTDFNRLQFGGTTSSFPALKRSSAGLQARLADDSAFTTIQASNYISDDGSTGITGATCSSFKNGICVAP